MEISVIEDAEAGVGFRTDVADFDAGEGEMVVEIADGNEEEMRTGGDVLAGGFGMWDLENCLDEGMVRLGTVSSGFQRV